MNKNQKQPAIRCKNPVFYQKLAKGFLCRAVMYNNKKMLYVCDLKNIHGDTFLKHLEVPPIKLRVTHGTNSQSVFVISITSFRNALKVAPKAKKDAVPPKTKQTSRETTHPTATEEVIEVEETLAAIEDNYLPGLSPIEVAQAIKEPASTNVTIDFSKVGSIYDVVVPAPAIADDSSKYRSMRNDIVGAVKNHLSRYCAKFNITNETGPEASAEYQRSFKALYAEFDKLFAPYVLHKLDKTLSQVNLGSDAWLGKTNAVTQYIQDLRQFDLFNPGMNAVEALLSVAIKFFKATN